MKWRRRSLVERAAAHFFFEALHALVSKLHSQSAGKLASTTLDPFYADR
jgi:hypothetical protein